MRIFLFILVLLILQLRSLAQRQCIFAEYKKELLKNSPELLSRVASVEIFTKDLLQKKIETNDTASGEKMPSVIIIPVVVHVVYNSASQNISDAQIRSQIDVLNKDYRRQNSDADKTPLVFKSVAADCGFQFELAQVDPQGYSTTGIVRKYSTIQGFSINDDVKSSAKGGDDAWDCNSYLNIWVSNLSAGILGYSSVPGGPKERDGVVIQYSAFGTLGTASSPFNKGRTATHEIGHWLNLIHTWGDADCGTDYVEDTPPQRAANRGCPDAIRITCGTGPNGDMYMNYMDFTDDACMNLFTQGQRERMRALFAPGGVRYAMLSAHSVTSTSQKPILGSESTQDNNDPVIHIYPNPTTAVVILETNNVLNPVVDIYNEMGQKIKSVTLNQHTQQVDMSSFPAGIYYIRANNGKDRKVTKLVKM